MWGCGLELQTKVREDFTITFTSSYRVLISINDSVWSLNTVLNVEVLVCAVNHEKALTSVIMISSRTFVWSSTRDRGMNGPAVGRHSRQSKDQFVHWDHFLDDWVYLVTRSSAIIYTGWPVLHQMLPTPQQQHQSRAHSYNINCHKPYIGDITKYFWQIILIFHDFTNNWYWQCKTRIKKRKRSLDVHK